MKLTNELSFSTQSIFTSDLSFSELYSTKNWSVLETKGCQELRKNGTEKWWAILYSEIYKPYSIWKCYNADFDTEQCLCAIEVGADLLIKY